MKEKIALFCLLFVFTFSKAQNPQLAPRNEITKDPSLEQFVRTLLLAIDKKNESYLYSLLDYEVSAEIGGEGGIEEFKRVWEPENDSSHVWRILKHIINLGGVFLDDPGDETGKYQFVFPYVYDMDFDMEDDYYRMGVITGKNVNLREHPNTNSKVLAQLTYDVVLFKDKEDTDVWNVSGTNEYGGPEWYQVETYDHSKSGWINWLYVYSPMSYRLFLYKTRQGDWKISAFLAGD